MTGVLVMGAGAVGCFVGGLTQLAGVPVHFVGRPRVLANLRKHGLRLTDLDGLDRRIPPLALRLHEQPPATLKPDLVLLCVKSGATVEAATALGLTLPLGSAVVSLQNGIGNAAAARQAAPQLHWHAGMVPYNIAEIGPGHYHRGTGGALAAEGSAGDLTLAAWQTALAGVGMGLTLHADLAPVQWGKLLLNLNNPVNALSGLPLREQLLLRGYRRVLAALQQEALDLLDAAHRPVAQLTPLPPRRLLALLRMPTFVFRMAASRMLRIDAKARSSMADDLAAGRPTEIDALCGEVVRLGRAQGRGAPLNLRMQGLVRDWPKRQQPYSPDDLLQAIGLS
ncbi:MULTISPECIES: 2-dehydropantoate 2-reductase [unclassified Roseateles]|uniref:2-dehydropantoate 2-reductase n=1 Tax=unclassified Roseateles TaxID=2626991 RepID=UPI0007005F1C|nr:MULTISPECIES: 2-dehydropantoate 2-reductase [unclassified Roseateles]KQW49819.1 2-dehydropantoate 2-reductase [Pelomonas sp. Root405]KRA76486.1 2-dehydropantoate 2-reductase [Pelomonas sp. Root662]